MQLWHPDFVSVLEDCIRRYRIPHQGFRLELTKNALRAHEDDHHVDLLTRLIAEVPHDARQATLYTGSGASDLTW